MFSTLHSGIFVLPFALSLMIWHIANIPSIWATVEIPPYRFTLLNVNLDMPLIGSAPTHPINSPIPAAIRPLNIDPFEREAIRVMAQKQSEKYSHGPSFNARLAISGERTVAKRIEKIDPIKDAVIPIPKAFPA